MSYAKLPFSIAEDTKYLWRVRSSPLWARSTTHAPNKQRLMVRPRLISRKIQQSVDGGATWVPPDPSIITFNNDRCTVPLRLRGQTPAGVVRPVPVARTQARLTIAGEESTPS